MLRNTRDHRFFLLRSFNLNCLKIMSVTIIVNSEKIKMKKSNSPTTFAFHLPSLFWFPLQFFLKTVPFIQFFGNFVSPPSKKGGRMGKKTMRIYLKNYIIIINSSYVLVKIFWSLLNVFTAVDHMWCFCKNNLR